MEGNVITGNEKLFLEIKLGKKKNGTEKIYLESAILAKNIPLKDKEVLIKKEYPIKDDAKEKIIQERNNARIGITLANFMNKIEKISPILNKCLKLINTFNVNDVQKLSTDITSLINEFKITNIYSNSDIREFLFDINYFLSGNPTEKLKMLIEKYSKEKEGNKEYLEILKFVESLFHLKPNYLRYTDLIGITIEILNKPEDSISNNYNFLLLNLIQNLEHALKKQLKPNKPLLVLLRQVFNIFYADFDFAKNPNNLLKFLSETKKSMENNPYNTYYREMYKYVSSIQNFKTSNIIEKFKNFSLQDMCNVFIKSLIQDINCISSHYKEVPSTIFNTITVAKNIYKYELTSFYELFNISKYYILENKQDVQKCKLCGRFFITQVKQTETTCRRIYKDNYTCTDVINKSLSASNSEISDIKNKTESMLRKRDNKNNTNELKLYRNNFDNNINEFNNKYSSKEEADKKIIEWAKKEHERLKLKNK